MKEFKITYKSQNVKDSNTYSFSVESNSITGAIVKFQKAVSDYFNPTIYSRISSDRRFTKVKTLSI